MVSNFFENDEILFRVVSNYQRGHTGQMSLITAAMNAAGLLVGSLFILNHFFGIYRNLLAMNTDVLVVGSLYPSYLNLPGQLKEKKYRIISSKNYMYNNI